MQVADEDIVQALLTLVIFVIILERKQTRESDVNGATCTYQ